MNNSDSITLSRMHFDACHGALPEEKTKPQPWEVTVTLHLSLADAGRTDDLSKTIDYRSIHKIVHDVMHGPPLNLAEALAYRIADNLLHAFRAHIVDVEVCKLAPPVDFKFDGLRVRVRRERVSLLT